MSLYRSPLVHFLLLGGAVFALRGAISADRDPQRRPLLVPAVEVARMQQEAARAKGGPPEPEELEALVSGWVDDELLVREARERGWHRSDPVVQQRLLRNLRFLEEAPDAPAGARVDRALALELDRSDLVVRRRLVGRMRLELVRETRIAEPSDAELQALLDASPERYRVPGRVRLTQVFLSRDRRAATLAADAASLLAELRFGQTRPADARPRSDPSLLPAELPLSSEAQLSARFGPEFARRAHELEPGGWRGPVPSSYGLHLIWVHETRAARAPSLDEVRKSLRASWRAERERAALRAALSELRRNVNLQVEEQSWIPSTPASSSATASR